MTPYQPDEFRAQHLDGCTLDPDHAGACLLARPFRIRPEGGREYLDHDEAPRPTTPGPDTRQRAEQFVRDCIGPEYVADFDVPAIADRLYDLARSWDVGSVETFDFWQTVKAHDRSQDDDEPDDSAGQEVPAPRDGDDAAIQGILNIDRAPAPRDGDDAAKGPDWDLSKAPAPRDGDDASEFGDFVRASRSARRDGDGPDDALPELTAASSVAEVRWVASEARALLSDPDPQRRARFLARKRALLDFIERTTGGGASS